ncbi:YkvA family protein [Austwickia chelonae]|uniref:YkvA family protein n=1 Tax=Austwickia chelonae TaxID=100225 RepID=UPI0009451024
MLAHIDLVPDFIPLLGYVDDALIAMWALQLAVRGAGRITVEFPWPGSPDGLRSVLFLVGLEDATAAGDERGGGMSSKN